MSVQAVLLVYLFGAAVLALWTDARFPGLAPSGLRSMVVRVVGAFALGYLVGPALTYLVGAGVAPALALFALVLPALVMIFLAAIWAIRMLQGVLYGLRG